MDKRVFGNCVITVLIWLCNRLAYYYLSKNTSLIVSGISLIIGCLIMWRFNHEYRWIHKQFTIPPDTYSYSDVVRVSVLNEKAKYKEKGIPFTAILPSGPLPSGILQDPYLFVGVKVV